MDELCSSTVRFDSVKLDGGGGGFDGEARLSLAEKRESTTVEFDGEVRA